MIGAEDMNKRFTYHPPKDDDIATFQTLRADAHDLGQFIDQHVPDGREKSLAITSLEEAVMWANAGIARADR